MVAAMTAVAAPSPSGIGALLREWRHRRRLSQLDLALEAGVSARHLSFVETGRSKPSAEMVLHLADQLEVPLRERNDLLLAAGYAPRYEKRALEDPEMAPVRQALDLVLNAHDPLPAVVADRHWNVVAFNAGMGMFLEGVAEHLLEPPLNVLRITLHPEGAAPRVANLGFLRHHLIEQVARQAALTNDPEHHALLEELRSYPGPEPEDDPPPPDGAPIASTDIVLPVRIHDGQGGELSFFSSIATFGTAVDVTVAELSIESFFAADERTAQVCADYVAALKG